MIVILICVLLIIVAVIVGALGTTAKVEDVLVNDKEPSPIKF